MTGADGCGSWDEPVPILSMQAKSGLKPERLQSDKVPVNTQTAQSIALLSPSPSPAPPVLMTG